MDKPLPPNKPLSDKIAAEAAKEIRKAIAPYPDMVTGGWKHPAITDAKLEAIIQSALSQSLAERDKEIEELADTMKLRGYTYAADMLMETIKARALLKGKAI